MQVYVKKSFLDKNIQDNSNEFNLDIVHTIPLSKYYFIYDKNGLSFVRDSENPKEILNINFLKGKLGWRLKRANHETKLKKALGKAKGPLNIFDATAGLLSDSMIFLSLGHSVVAVEQSKIIYLLLKDAIRRAKDAIPFLSNIKLINGNSINVIKKIDTSFDIIYLDPMYPILKNNIKKSGELSAIRSILAIEKLSSNEDSLINNFMGIDYKKIILKRPLKSKKIYSNINYQVKGRTTRFDIYL
tara:strand:- start:573 stop:1304 length:732 start_codon:yes stop_codon:yes gene_type:complete